MRILYTASLWVLILGHRAQAAGLYLTSYTDSTRQTSAMPYISGIHADLQWGDLQSGPGTYTWGPLDSTMAANAGQKFELVVRGNLKPAFLFDVVPYTANWGDSSVEDPQGILMYWHPTFISTYTTFISALAAHLSASPYQSLILGIDQEYSGIGEEHLDVPAANQKASTWTVPPGVTNGPDWTVAIKESYQMTVVDTFVSSFKTIQIMGRNDLDSTVLNHQATGQPSGFTYSDYFRNGTWYVLQTGSEMEPEGPNTASEYDLYFQYALPGYTVGYTIPYADAWGYISSTAPPDTRLFSPPQWNYWRLLSDLNMGVSDLALYADDVTVAQSATHYGNPVGSDYQTEFDQSFQFAARYAGHHIDPASAPGAWIAFRQSITNFSPSDYNQVTDYRRFMTLLNPQDTVGLDARKDGSPVPLVANRTVAGEQSIGPYNSRFGAWARSISSGHTAELQLDSMFAASVNAISGAEVRVTYLDNVVGGAFVTSFGTQSVTTTLSNSGAWQTIAIPITSTLTSDAAGGHIAIRCTSQSVIFHMVEVAKPVTQVVNAASYQSALAPGSLVSIFGSNLASSTASASSMPLPVQLADVSVTFNGPPAPLLYVSPSQINAQIPYETLPGSVTMVVSANGVAQQPVAIAVADSAPGVFQTSLGQALAQNHDGTWNTPTNRAKAGTWVTVYLTGLGNVTNQPANGAAAPGSPLSIANLPVTVLVDGVSATVQFAGLAPGFAGLAQVNFQVPNVTASVSNPLVIQVGSNVSHVTMLSTN